MLDLRLPHGLSPGLDLLCLANSVLRFREGSSEEPPPAHPPRARPPATRSLRPSSPSSRRRGGGEGLSLLLGQGLPHSPTPCLFTAVSQGFTVQSSHLIIC